jgi:hypothetical protein
VLCAVVVDPDRREDDMDTIAAVLFGALVLYIAAGLVIALAFVATGVTRVQPAPVTLGARILLVPGATALWPVVLRRWIKSAS